MTQLTGKSKGDNLQAALQMMGMSQAQAALKAASYDLSRGDMAGYQKNLTEAFTGIDPGQMRRMSMSHAMCSPGLARGGGFSAQRVNLAKGKSGLGGALLGGAAGWALGGPLGGLAGGLIGRFLSKRGKAKCMERRLNRDPIFRSQFEAMTGGKYVRDGRIDGKITIVRPNFGLPGMRPGAFGALGGNLVAGSAMSGMARMMGQAANIMGGFGMTGGGFGIPGGELGGMLSGGLGYGGLNNGINLKQRLGISRSQGGFGSRVANLPPNATFEDLVAAFMMDTMKDMQDEAKQQMDRLKRSNQARNRRGYGGMLGGLGSLGGGLLGGMVGGPVGASIGQGLGGAVGRGLGGQGAQGEDSRQLMFEELKNTMQKLQQMMQSMSNVLNTMHQGSMNSIRNIRA
jgi:hypothetical protein